LEATGLESFFLAGASFFFSAEEEPEESEEPDEPSEEDFSDDFSEDEDFSEEDYSAAAAVSRLRLRVP
jgi:hypothetical protein